MLNTIEELFGTADLYAVINITASQAADPKKLRAGYLRAALAYHPDKAKEDEKEESTKKFQLIKKIYELLQEDDLRKAYDQTGEWPEGDDYTLDEGSFGRLDPSTIEEFRKMYEGSDEERNDIKRYYIEGKGDIFHVMDNVFFLNVLTDEERVKTIIEDLIENKEVKKMTGGVLNQKQRDSKIRKAKNEAVEAEGLKKELGLGDSTDSLRQAIMKRGADRMANLIGNMEAKYGGQKKGKAKSKINEDTDESESDDEPVSKQSRKVKKAKDKDPPPKSGRSTRTRSGSKK